jgi:ABC-type spermidine/putrescine transport system permease subunit II
MTREVVVLGGTKGARLLLAAVVVLGLILIYAPAVYLLLASLNPSMQLGLVPPDTFSLVWYRELLHDRRLISALTESTVVGLATAAVATPVGLTAALAFRAMGARRGLFFLFILFAMFVPGTIQGLGLSVLFKVIALKPSWITVAIGHLLWALPFAFTVSLVSLAVVRPNMIAAARDLGANYWQVLRDVILPLVRGGIASSFVFSFLLSFNEYARAYYLVGRQNTLPLTMFGAMNSGASPTIYALSGAILIVSFGIVGVLLVIGRWRLSQYERGPTITQTDPRALSGAALADQYGR